jgi:phosphoribosylanthranilate isomerase
MAVRVKICGITNVQDALGAVEAGAWALGFIFHKKSVRYISPGKVRAIVGALPPFVVPVGVFVNEKEAAVRHICRLTRITTVQFHGEESSGYCRRFKGFKIIKAFRVNDSFDFKSVIPYTADAYLFDTFSEAAAGGTGKTFNWDILKHCKFDKPVILSGGLNPGNIRQAVEAIHPYAVDVSSGVETSPGNKACHLIQSFTAVLR